MDQLIDLAESILIIGCVCVPIFAGFLMARQDDSPGGGPGGIGPGA